MATTKRQKRDALRQHFGSAYIGEALHDIKANNAKEVRLAFKNASIGHDVCGSRSFLKQEYNRLVTIFGKVLSFVTESDLLKGPSLSVNFLDLYVKAKQIWDETMTLKQLKRVVCEFVSRIRDTVSWLKSLLFSVGESKSDGSDDVVFNDVLVTKEEVEAINQVSEEVEACESFLDASGEVIMTLIRWIVRLFIPPLEWMKNMTFSAMKWSATFIGETYNFVQELHADHPSVLRAKKTTAHLVMFSSAVLDLLVRRAYAGADYLGTLLTNAMDTFKRIFDLVMIALSELDSLTGDRLSGALTYLKETRVWQTLTSSASATAETFQAWNMRVSRFININMTFFFSLYPTQLLYGIVGAAAQRLYVDWLSPAIDAGIEMAYDSVNYLFTGQVDMSLERLEQLKIIAVALDNDNDGKKIEEAWSAYKKEANAYGKRQSERNNKHPTRTLIEDLKAAWKGSGVAADIYIGRKTEFGDQEDVALIEQYLGESIDVLVQMEEKKRALLKLIDDVFTAYALREQKKIGNQVVVTRRRRRRQKEEQEEKIERQDESVTRLLKTNRFQSLADAQQKSLAVAARRAKIDGGPAAVYDMVKNRAKFAVRDEQAVVVDTQVSSAKARLLRSPTYVKRLILTIGMGAFIVWQLSLAVASRRRAQVEANRAYFIDEKKREDLVFMLMEEGGDASAKEWFTWDRERIIRKANEYAQNKDVLKRVMDRIADGTPLPDPVKIPADFDSSKFNTPEKMKTLFPWWNLKYGVPEHREDLVRRINFVKQRPEWREKFYERIDRIMGVDEEFKERVDYAYQPHSTTESPVTTYRPSASDPTKMVPVSRAKVLDVTLYMDKRSTLDEHWSRSFTKTEHGEENRAKFWSAVQGRVKGRLDLSDYVASDIVSLTIGKHLTKMASALGKSVGSYLGLDGLLGTLNPVISQIVGLTTYVLYVVFILQMLYTVATLVSSAIVWLATSKEVANAARLTAEVEDEQVTSLSTSSLFSVSTILRYGVPALAAVIVGDAYQLADLKQQSYHIRVLSMLRIS